MEINAVSTMQPSLEVKAGGDSQGITVRKAANEGAEAAVQMNMRGLNEYQAKGSEDMLKEAITAANDRLKFGNNDCEFMYHKEVGRISIKVINRDTQEVIKEIPSEETLEMIKKLKEMTGLLVDERR